MVLLGRQLCPSPFPGSRACSTPSGSLLSSIGVAAHFPCPFWHKILKAQSLLVLFPFAVRPEGLLELGGRKGSMAASLKHPEDAAWKCPWNTVGALASRKCPHGTSPDFSWQAKVWANTGSAQQLELLISARAAGFPVRSRVCCTICPSNPLTSAASEG